MGGIEAIDAALVLAFLLLLGERITRIIVERKASRRRNNETATNPGHPNTGVAGALESLATVSQSVLSVATRVEAIVQKNADENQKAHKNIHERIDGVVGNIGVVDKNCAVLAERIANVK